MRNETEMLELIVKTANEDDRIRAVYMSGSRVNCNVPNDALADYDIVYVVKDTKPFYEDSHYMERFGEILYMQEPDRLDASVGKKLDFNEKYTWLVIYTDGNRIDLTVCNEKKADITGDRVYRVLLDKDGRFANAPVSDDRARWVKKPSEAEYAAVCNEFWWCINNVVKGIKRYEITYAQDMMNYYVRPMLLKMLSWKVGILTDFSVSVGKSGKYMNKWLLDDDYEMYYLNQRNAKLEIKEGIDKYYLSQLLKFEQIKKRLTGISRGVRQANISNKDILNLVVPIPPLELQNQFADFVKHIDKSKLRYQLHTHTCQPNTS